jgi:hypothetical protein
MLTALYPQYEWLPWKFKRAPYGFWESATNQLQFMDWVGKQLNVKEMIDWYNVTLQVEYWLKYR